MKNSSYTHLRLRQLRTLWLMLCLALAACGNTGMPKPPGGGGDGGGDDEVTSFWLPYTTQDNSVVATYNPQVAVDAQGGVHVAYAITAGQDAGQRPAYYAYCSSACDDLGNWSRLRLGERVAEVRLLLDQAGHPRLILYLDNSTGPDDLSYTYVYAACDTECVDSGNWTLTPLTDSYAVEAYRTEYSNRYFALDPQGRPGFVYIDFNNPNGHNGTYYAFCQTSGSACNDVANWFENRIVEGLLWRPQLVYTRDGLPRILAEEINMEQNYDKLVYVECNADCSQFSGTFLYDSDGYARATLRLNSADEPRVVYYSGFYPNDLEPQQLYYLSCDTDCAQAQNWQAASLNTSIGNGWYVDLQLDKQDRPRFVYKMGDVGPGYAWCNANCEREGSEWESLLIEDRAVLEEDFPVMPIVDCSISTWTSGHFPTLALDPQGNPRVAFVAMHQYAGTDTRPGHIGEPCPVQTDIKLARFSMFAQP